MKKPKKRPISAAEKKRLVKAGTEVMEVAKKDLAFKLRLKSLLDRTVKDEDDRVLLREEGWLD